MLQCGILVIGGGAAGARAAYEAKSTHPELDVYIAVNGAFDLGGSTNMIASEALGINAPFNYEADGDTPELYLEDTLETGGGLANPDLCRILAYESADRITELSNLGVRFKTKDGRPEQQRLSGCKKARSLTCGGSTGRQITLHLKQACLDLGVRILENTTMLGLWQGQDGTVHGAWGHDPQGSLCIQAGAVILATGGAGSLFSVNVTSPTQTGDGWAMAYEAGCQFANMEFFQVGPAVVHPNLTFIIHSHMWRFLPKLTNRNGEEFLPRYCGNAVTTDKALELKAMSYPFSVRTDAKYVDIGIFREIAEGRGSDEGGIYLDVTHIPKNDLLEKAPITYETLRNAGIDCASTPVQITMAVQNFNGGILIDGNGWTGINGLYAAGEATGGVHGSDRPGGNNLTDTQVFGFRAGRAAAEYAATAHVEITPDLPEVLVRPTADEQKLIEESEKLYYQELTVIRNEKGLRHVLEFVEHNLKPGISAQLRNRLLLGQLLAMAQLTRTESRGTHYRDDYPDTNPEWKRRLILQKGSDGKPIIYQQEGV